MYRLSSSLLCLAPLLLVACSDPSSSDSGPSADLGSLDRGPDSLVLPDAGKVDCKQALVAPTTRIWPSPGEVFYMQLGLSGSMGEAAIVVGPAGRVVLIDVGNDSHDDDVRLAVNAIVDRVNQTAGFPKASRDQVEHILLTHFHADHSDGVADLLANMTVTGRVVHRGYLDVKAASDATVNRVCKALQARPDLEVALCDGPAKAPCGSSWSGSYPSRSCKGLQAGSLIKSGASGTAHLPLGGSARLDVVAVDGYIGTESYEAKVKPMSSQSNGENARSMMGLLRLGPFGLMFNGDLTGGGDGTDNVEGFYATRLWPHLDQRGADVMHAAHHGRKTSSSKTWADRVLPADGRDRNVVMGIGPAYVGSPHQQVLTTLLGNGRLGNGLGWTTGVAPNGATDGKLVDAKGGSILIRTLKGGQAYEVQAIDTSGAVVTSRAFYAVGACP